MANKKNILMVCTGNTCRSPMAEGLAKHILAQHLKTTPDSLPSLGYTISSAGTFAYGGAPVSVESVQALKPQGIDISSHTANPLTDDLIDQADVIYTMTASHRHLVLSVKPDATHKTHRLIAEQDVSDPIGQGLPAYLKAAEMIRTGIQQRLEEML